MPRSRRVRSLRALAASMLAVSLLVPAASPVAAQDELVLRVGTTQDLDSINPFATALVVGFEVFTLNYELLTSFDQQLATAPGFAESWSANEDGTVYTFKIPAGKLWSDGQPATAEDARWTFQLVLDSVASELEATGLGYLDAYLTDAGVTTVEAPDPETLVVTLDRANDRILHTYVPILPKHIWEAQTPETVGDYLNEPPIVGSGPYQAVEWQTGQFVRFVKNPNWSHEALAADEVVIQIFASSDTMVQALRSGDLDYASGVNPDQFDQLAGEVDIVTVAGTANGFTELGFNAYGTGTGNTIEGGGPSTPALLDPAFRDALGYAIDKDLLVERVLGGYGEPGTTQVPPFQTAWHTPPVAPRTFDIALAGQKLEAAGYALDGNGRRLDKDGNPISLDLVFPDSEDTYPQSAEFIEAWFGELGITVSPQQYDSDTLVDIMLPPEAGEYVADYDLFIWGWGGDVDPNSLLSIFLCEEIGNSSDSLWCNPEYDELFTQQNEATIAEARKGFIDQMQDIMYREAPYHILFYDANLHAYRTDTFSGWQNQPDNGVPLFGYGPYGYTVLTVAGEEPTPEPSASPTEGGGATAAPSPSPSGDGGTPAASDNTVPLVLGVIGIVVILAVGLVFMRRRGQREEEE
jgi:peptide/nickel transport system substrate-binding protein